MNKNFIMIFLSLFLLSCTKKEECIIIEDKYESNGSYYFYFLNNTINNNNSLDVDPLGTGKVSKEVYDDYTIGDKYCF